MTILSKLSYWSHDFNCYESFHTWTPHCSQATLDITSSCFVEGFKMYLVVNLIAQLLQRRLQLKDFEATIKNTFRSAAFIAITPGAMYATYCLLR